MAAIRSLLRRLLLMPLPPDGVRLVDVVILPVGMVVAMVVCLPILAVTLLASAVVGVALDQIGAPSGLSAIPGLAGLIGGLALCFVVLLRLYRRLPRAVRSWVTPESNGPADEVSAPAPFARDRNADGSTLQERITRADAALASGDPASDADDVLGGR